MIGTSLDRPLILVTGGAGYIGSHCCVELLQSGYDVAIVDNLCNSFRAAVDRVEKLAGRSAAFHHVDLLDAPALEEVFAHYDTERGSRIQAVIHFAGLKAVGESHEKPLEYYHNNISGSLLLFQCMERHSVRRLVYSSSATVYGEPLEYPIHEKCSTAPNSPYGQTKLVIEKIIEDTSRTCGWQSVILRYFNPVGAHPSGQLGEHPQGIPNNLMPYLSQVAVGKLPSITVFGTDYFTRDGTGLRDYIHVIDLCRGHLAALREVNNLIPKGTTEVFNLGTGTGYTVLEMIEAFTGTTKASIPFQLGPRRPGDVAVLLADPTKANEQLKWSAEYGLTEMCADLWKWQSNYPSGLQ